MVARRLDRREEARARRGELFLRELRARVQQSMVGPCVVVGLGREVLCQGLHGASQEKTAAEAAVWYCSRPCSGDRADRNRLLALGAVLHFEFNLLVLLQGLEAGALDFGEVGEEILAAAVGFDEAEAFGIVEPLHGTGGHCVFPLLIKPRVPPGTGASE